MIECPRCKSQTVHRSRVRSIWEEWRRDLTQKRPFRCHQCGWRGWSIDLGPKFDDDVVEEHAKALESEHQPNLSAAVLPKPEVRVLEELNLAKLDHAIKPNPKPKPEPNFGD